MAKLVTSVTVFFFLLSLLTLSHARDIQTPFSESKPEYEPEIQPQPKKPQPHDTVSFTIDSIDPFRSTFLHFRPINRHLKPARLLPSQLPLSLRTGHRRCRHGPRREIPYGKDAIVLSDAAGADQIDGVRRIPTRWVRFHRVSRPRFPETVSHSDSDNEQHHHIHGDHHHHHHHEGWFNEKMRNFLNMF